MQKLDLLHAVLVLNGVDAELIGMRKVPRRRIHRFPAGYDPTLFALSASGTPRSIRMRASSVPWRPRKVDRRRSSTA